jgi:thioredoxin
MTKPRMKFSGLIIISLLIISACDNSKKSDHKIAVPIEEIQTDEYAALKESNVAPQKIVEDLSGNIIVLTEKDFIERITALDNPRGFRYLGQTPCIVELYTHWCKPCIILSNILADLAQEYKGKVIFYKLNVEKAQSVQTAFNIQNIPTLLYFKPRGKVSTTVGLINKEKLTNVIDDLLLKP